MAAGDLGGTKPPLFIIDSYAQIYRSYFAFMSRPLKNASGENVSALFGFSKMIAGIVGSERLALNNEQKPNVIATFDSRTPTFRHKRYPAYKATRQKAPEDLHAQVPKVETFLRLLGVPSMRVDGYEADDIIATLAKICRKDGSECAIFSSDKDLLQLVGGVVYQMRPGKNTQNSQFDRIGVDEVKAEWGISPEKILDLLALMGDSSDNVPGVKGIGEKTAVKLLQRFGSLDRIYENIAVIEGALGKKLADDRENAFLSRELITLCDSVPLPPPSDVLPPVLKLNREAAAEYLSGEGIPSIAKLLLRNSGESFTIRSSAGSDGNQTNNLQLPTTNYQLPPTQNPENQNPETRNSLSSHLTGDGNYRVVTNIDELKKIFAKAAEQGFIALDFETDSLNAWNARPAGFSFAIKPKEAFYTPVVMHGGAQSGADFLDGDAARALLAGLFADSNMTIIAHNSKYDYEVSRGWGFPRWKASIFDTMIGAWLCDSSRIGYSLDSLAFAHFGYNAIAYKDVVPKGGIFADVPLDIACRYSAEDADLTLRLREILIPKLEEFGLKKLFEEIEMPLVPVLAEMEGAGIKIEASALETYGVELGIELKKIKAETWEAVGHPFNLSSPKQLQEVLFIERKLIPSKKTQRGWSTDITVLEELAREDRVPELILRHRALSKLKSTYVDTLGSMADCNGRVHTSFIQTGTATGRLSSRDPNLQNIPIRDEGGRRIREAFAAAPGNLLISADYSQIELVILAHLSRDTALVAAFNEGVDVHTRTAALIFGEAEDKIDPAKRRIAKTINFGVMYGMSAFRLSGELKIGRREAADFIDAYFKTYSGVRDFINGLIAKTEQDGYVSTIFGRFRAINTINSRNKTEKSAAERIAVNTPIQGSAADIVKKAMLDVDKVLDEKIARLLLQVHDELILECAEPEADEVASIVQKTMENAVKLSVPLRVSVETGKRWGEFH